MTDLKGPEVGLRALFRLVEACEDLEPIISEEAEHEEPEDLEACLEELNRIGGLFYSLQESVAEQAAELARIRALAEAVRLDILDKAPPGLD